MTSGMQGGKEGQKKHTRGSVQTAPEKEAKQREKERKKEAAATAEAEAQRRRAELELLLMDESAALKAKPACKLLRVNIYCAGYQRLHLSFLPSAMISVMTPAV